MLFRSNKDYISNKKLIAFSTLGFICLLANNMSIMIYFSLLGWLFWTRFPKNPDLRYLKLFANEVGRSILFSFPILFYSLSRIMKGDVTRPYLNSYYFTFDLKRIVGLSYDLITYHFNFIYNPTHYKALTLNFFSLPFVALFGFEIGRAHV